MTAPSPPRKRLHRSAQMTGVGMFGLLIAAAGLAWAMGSASFDIFGAVLLAPVLLIITAPIASKTGRIEGDAVIARIILMALLVKLVGSLVRYNVAYDVYGGNADAYTYHLAGKALAASIHHGHFVVPDAPIGTQFIVVLTGLVYAVIGPTKLGGFMLFAWLGFLGQFFFYRAFRIGYPAGDGRRYAKLIFFLPSMVFWPSSLGKESWMTLMIGLAAFGAARMLTHQRGGFVIAGLGLWGAASVRPHITLIFLAALFVAYIARRSSKRGLANPTFKIAGIAVMCLLATLAIGRATRFFGVEKLNAQGVTSVLDRTQTQTSQGKSAFTPVRVNNPVKFPLAFITVCCRPFPTEAHNPLAMMSAIEGAFLLTLLLFGLKRLVRVPRELLRSPYLLFCVMFALAFVYAFSSIGNFGILVRQRVQVFPFVLAVLSVRKTASVVDDANTDSVPTRV